jgi:hypothetical protein
MERRALRRHCKEARDAKSATADFVLWAGAAIHPRILPRPGGWIASLRSQ